MRYFIRYNVTARDTIAQNWTLFFHQFEVIPLKLFYYQPFLWKLGIINIHDMNIKKMQ